MCPAWRHRERDVDVARLAAVGPALAGEVLEQEPRADPELVDPVPHARLDVLDEVADLEHAGERLAESKQRHAAFLSGCRHAARCAT